MVKQTIQIYCRLKPSNNNATQLYETDEDGDGNPLISFNVPKDKAGGLINNKKEVYRFRFDNVFQQSTKQEEIFDVITKPVIDNVLSGYNGTIFAYGQTGSGKTFTITGGAERYADRGIIPRSLSYIFAHYEEHSDYEYQTHISYLEIYNDHGYDLLDPRHEAAKLEDLPKVNLLEDGDGNIHLRNLSVHPVQNEEDALNLLFLGDTNRMIAETPMNQASTRSHCIFTVHITTKDPTTAKIRRSKMHLVDLAGSERVSKTGVVGTLLSEAKFINLSLHCLEQVIIALSEKSRTHIPYRNSMMTSVLRDSLGGNCMTTMIATCSVEKKNIDESISTCRFAQRVAMIKNDAILNEEVDPKLVIARLKREIQELKDELAMATGQEYDGVLSEEDKDSLRNLVRIYLEDTDSEATLSVGADMRKINYCFSLLKEFYHEKATEADSSSARESRYQTPLPDRAESNYLANVGEVKKLKELILQRDNEINILVSMLKKEKQKNANANRIDRSRDTELFSRETRSHGYSSNTEPSMNSREQSFQKEGSATSLRQESHVFSEERPSTALKKARHAKIHDNESSKAGNMSVARQEAFDTFKRNYPQNHTAQEQKQLLKEKYTEARSLGEQVNQSRKSINTIKARIEQQRIRHSMQGLTGSVDMGEPNAEEIKLRELLNKEKATYKEAFTKLKSLKTEIEHLQHLLEKSKVQMQKDFEIWWAETANIHSQVPAGSKAAWKTPPVTPERPLHEILQDKRQGNPKTLQNSRSASYDHSSRTSSSSSLNERTSELDGADTRTDGSGRMANKLRAEAQLASSLFSANDPRSLSLSQLAGKKKDSNARKSASMESKQTGIQLTGDSKTDADIMAFMKARQNLLQNSGRS